MLFSSLNDQINAIKDDIAIVLFEIRCIKGYKYCPWSDIWEFENYIFEL